MTIEELNQTLDDVINTYKDKGGEACSYCSDELTGNALQAIYVSTADALAMFKTEILTYLSQS